MTTLNADTAPTTATDDLRLIEAGFPCHQVGAETQRERGASSALPPLYYLHVWWARRPLTPSRAAILGATLPAETSTEDFLRALGIAKPVVQLPCGGEWTLVNPTMLGRVKWDADKAAGRFKVDTTVLSHFKKEVKRRAEMRNTLTDLAEAVPFVAEDPVLAGWRLANEAFGSTELKIDETFQVVRQIADAAAVQDRIALGKFDSVKAYNGGNKLKIDPEDLYGYDRAFTSDPPPAETPLTILDPTAGGGSIPFEALRLGHNVIANELNPVATVILHATLDFPRRFGPSLADNIQRFGDEMVIHVGDAMEEVTPFCDLPKDQMAELQKHLEDYPDLIDDFSGPEHDQTGLIYCRQVTCPHCGGQAPLLNSYWLSKEAGNRWAVEADAKSKQEVTLTPYRIDGNLSKAEADALDAGTVTDGNGTCLHCRQRIEGDDIKMQGRDESEHGTMTDRLFCVVGVRYQPKLDRQGKTKRYGSGARKGELHLQKLRFFRSPTTRDFDALELADRRLKEKWDHFERLDLIPTEDIPAGHKTGDEGGAGSGTDKPLKLGTNKWYQMFTPRQLLGHLTLMEKLRELKPQILEELGAERGKAVVTYLQFAIDKGLDYNSRQTRWIYQRGQVAGTFSRHDFSFKWTFGEMVFSGPHTGPNWCVGQIVDAYNGIAKLVENTNVSTDCRIVNGSGAGIAGVADASVDVVVNDPPYYNNLMYAELSDYFYVWQKRTLASIFPEQMSRYLTDKESEAVANSHRDGSSTRAEEVYEKLMSEIYTECHRVVKQDGRMVLMFTHKKQNAWETLTNALIGSGWILSATYPIDSEFGNSMHIKDNASAESSIFIVCRKRPANTAGDPALWKAMGGRGVQSRIVEAVKEGLVEFERLKLRPVDTMVASYGRALRVLSEKWPVMDGDAPVSPLRAMNEASRVVAQHHIRKLTGGRLKVDDLAPEAAMAVTLYGICGTGEVRYDEALNISRSLNIALEARPAGYTADARSIGVATEVRGRRAGRDETDGYHAPLVRKNSKLRLALPEERSAKRLATPQHEWDVLQGLILRYREGDVPVARAYLKEHAELETAKVLDLLRVWTNEAGDADLRKEGETMLFGLA